MVGAGVQQQELLSRAEGARLPPSHAFWGFRYPGMTPIAILWKRELAASDGTDNEQRLVAGGDRLRQGGIGRFLGKVFRTRKESHEGAALPRDVIANCAAQHRITRFNCVDHRANRDRAAHLKMNLAAYVRQGTKMWGKHHANRSRGHAIVCTSTDNTAGRSRTIGFHVFPESAEQ